MHKTWVLVSEDLVTFSSHPATQQHEGTNTCDVCRLSSLKHTPGVLSDSLHGVHMAGGLGTLKLKHHTTLNTICYK